MLKPLNDEDTMWITSGERSFLRQPDGGCQVPMGVHGTIHRGQLTLKALIASVDGQIAMKAKMSGPAKSADIMQSGKGFIRRRR